MHIGFEFVFEFQPALIPALIVAGFTFLAVIGIRWIVVAARGRNDADHS